MKKRGFAIVSTSSDLFSGEDEAKKGDFLVGAILKPETLNLCSSVSGAKGNLTLAVEWKIYDRKAGQVVETVTTTGDGQQEKFASDGLKRMVDAAFVANLATLVQRGAVQKYVGEPSPQADPLAKTVQ